ncbi:hypothetical protein RHGRI_000465 [Rhododendron griersonianum]|uniref:Uncharacterized protein n=1 Tax=Rhododendron griersonianum TaxID=479676 RepID=A0AAV6LHL1_9ERIC|nr:hypothetical protein RHGRI_000465 [Rhododendron griersonianum]
MALPPSSPPAMPSSCSASTATTHLALLSNAVITNGVSRVEAEEEELDPRVGRECMADPRCLGGVRSLEGHGQECESLEPEKAKDSIEGFSRRMELGILTLRLRSLRFSEPGSCR